MELNAAIDKFLSFSSPELEKKYNLDLIVKGCADSFRQYMKEAKKTDKICISLNTMNETCGSYFNIAKMPDEDFNYICLELEKLFNNRLYVSCSEAYINKKGKKVTSEKHRIITIKPFPIAPPGVLWEDNPPNYDEIAF